MWLRAEGFYDEIKRRALDGTAVIGICGGYQMLGTKLFDPHHSESNVDEIDGLGLLPLTTTFAIEKLTRQVTLDRIRIKFLDATIDGRHLEGYEIHAGETQPSEASLMMSAGNVFGT